MVLLQKLTQFGVPQEDLKSIYIAYVRSILEQSAVVWHSALSAENRNELERVQKSASKLI